MFKKDIKVLKLIKRTLTRAIFPEINLEIISRGRRKRKLKTDLV